MSTPLTKRERRLKRKLRRQEEMLGNIVRESPQIVYKGRRGVFIPVLHDPAASDRRAKLVNVPADLDAPVDAFWQP